jgi:hypothetical protein
VVVSRLSTPASAEPARPGDQVTPRNKPGCSGLSNRRQWEAGVILRLIRRLRQQDEPPPPPKREDNSSMAQLVRLLQQYKETSD